MSSPDNPQFDLEPLNPEPPPSAQVVIEPFPSDLQPEPATPLPKAGENPVWSGWDVLQIAGLTILTMFLSQLLISLGARHFIFRHSTWLEVAQKPVLALVSQLVTYAGVGLYMFLLVEGKYHARFGQAIRWKWPGIAGATFLGLALS